MASSDPLGLPGNTLDGFKVRQLTCHTAPQPLALWGACRSAVLAAHGLGWRQTGAMGLCVSGSGRAPLSLHTLTLKGRDCRRRCVQVDISHQEMDRIIRELELIYQSQPTTVRCRLSERVLGFVTAAHYHTVHGLLEAGGWRHRRFASQPCCIEADGGAGRGGTQWLPVEGLGMMMMTELGYEDMDELEDALKGTWPQFLGALPHVELGALDPVTGKQVRHAPARPLEGCAETQPAT
jgi:hypothetical protein